MSSKIVQYFELIFFFEHINILEFFKWSGVEACVFTIANSFRSTPLPITSWFMGRIYGDWSGSKSLDWRRCEAWCYPWPRDPPTKKTQTPHFFSRSGNSPYVKKQRLSSPAKEHSPIFMYMYQDRYTTSNSRSKH